MKETLLFLNHNYFVFVPVLLIILKYYTLDLSTIKTTTNRRLLPYYNLIFLGTLYPIGKLCQFTSMGPVWVRSYLSDIGFVAFIATYGCVRHLSEKNHFIGIRRSAAYWLIIGLGIAIGYEFFQMWLDATVVMNKKVPFTGRGDWMDICVYIFTAGVCLLFVKSMQEPIVVTEQHTIKQKKKKNNNRLTSG